MLQRELIFALMGTGFTCLATVLGAGMVFFFRKDMSANMQRIFLGFAAGVMIAASVWSLLIPAMEMAEEQGQFPLLPVGGGFLLGGLLLMALDRLLPHLHPGSGEPEGLPAHLKRTTMIVLAVTLHNIPEGMAVGLAFAIAARDTSGGSLAGALALALGMALQNFPEGAAISLPLRRDGLSPWRAFGFSQLSALAETLAAMIGAALTIFARSLLPFVLSFAAGAMVFVVFAEIIPEAHINGYKKTVSILAAAGFAVMMFFDLFFS